MTLEAVIFDWGGTLTPWHTIDPLECWLSVTADADQAASLHAAENAAWRLARDEHRSATIADILDAASVSLTDDQWRAYFAFWDQHSFTDPAVGQLFTDLKERGLRIGILSNTVWPRSEHERIFRRDAVHELIDGAVYSSEIEWTKPDPRAFEAAMLAVGVQDPARAVFVGDRLFDDIYGAQRAGMRAVHVPHSDIPAWQTTGVEGSPDAVVQQLSDLVAVIDRWL
jgi:putative hydrolase of the HAD superfamily